MVKIENKTKKFLWPSLQSIENGQYQVTNINTHTVCACKKNVDQRNVSIFQKQSKNTAELAPYFGQIIKSKFYDDSIQCNANLLHLDERKVYRNQIDWLQCMNNCQCLRH